MFKINALNLFSTLATLCVLVALGWMGTQPQAYIGALIASLGVVFAAFAVIAYDDSLKSSF
jgi:hypothetical protein